MNPPRRGMMMVVAIVLLGLIGVALASLTEQTGADFKRLHAQTDSAQARQILIAATKFLLIDPDKAIVLPGPLLESGAALKITSITHQPDRIILRLDVISGKVRASEMLTLVPQPNGWSIADVQME